MEPPPAVLEGMVALRLYLDACPADNGALEVIPGSFRLGRIPHAEVVRLAQASPPPMSAPPMPATSWPCAG